MATYKVIQDIEAEDKLLGPLTLRQFIYAIIVLIAGFMIFRLSIAGLWWLAVPLLPIAGFFALLAAPFGQDQSSEVWLLAKIRFALKPRKRIWDQSGVKQLVTITAPKKIEQILTKSLSQTEVKSRLRALADTIDSRGWAVKNVNVNLFEPPSYQTVPSDRLVGPSSLPQDVINADVTAMDDMLDERNNPAAQQLSQMIQASAQSHRQQVVSRLKNPDSSGGQGNNSSGTTSPPPNYWFLSENQSAAPPPGYATIDSRVVAPGQNDIRSSAAQSTPDDEAVLEQIRTRQAAEQNNPVYGHMRTVQPISQQAAQQPPAEPATSVTPARDPAILELANNDDLNVATIARQAEKAKKKEPPADEVVISLH